jgi:uncharacterized protein involved in outer membrane biogenesis
MRRRWIWFSSAAALIVLLVAARIALPYVVKRYVNSTLQGLNGYAGSIADIDISLWRGAYQIRTLEIDKTGGKVPVPFVSAETVDLSVEWGALLHGRIVAKIDLYDPKVNFVNAAKRQNSQAKVDKSWTDTVKSLVPFDINRVGVHNGQFHYRDFEANPRVDVFVQKFNATVRNLTNSEKFGNTLYATFDGSALAMGSGKIDFKGSLDPYAAKPTFAFEFSLNDLQLKQLNPFLRAYASVDAEGGTFSMDAAFKASRGTFNGYVKPFIKDLKVLTWKQDENVFKKLWEGTVQLIADVFENHSKERIATRIPFHGTVDDPSPNLLATLGGILQNAFLKSLQRGLEGSVDLGKSQLAQQK